MTGWRVEEVRRLLEAAEAGRDALRVLAEHRDLIEVRGVGQILYWEKPPGSDESEWRVAWEGTYGLTQYPADEGGTVAVSIARSMDSLDAAATIVHEVEHAQWHATGEGGWEVDARLREIAFYLQSGAAGQEALRHYYERFGVVAFDADGVIMVDEEAIRLRYGPASSYNTGVEVDWRYEFAEPWEPATDRLLDSPA